MNRRTRDSLKKFQTIVSKMSLEVCCQVVLPELGIKWSVLARTVRQNRLPMTSRSVGRVLRSFVEEKMPDRVDELLGLLQIYLVATTTGREWHTIKLLHPTRDLEPAAAWVPLLPTRVLKAARKQNARVEVHTTKLGDFIFISVEKVQGMNRSPPLFVAVTASEPVAFLTSKGCTMLIQSVVQGLGYKTYSDANLHGKDLISLLRIIDRTQNVNVNLLTDIPPYDPRPVITKNHIDYTNRAYNKSYVEGIIGPDPPLITSLSLKAEKKFFDQTRLNRKMKVSMVLKSKNVADTLKHWVGIKAIPPTSEFIKCFHNIKTNDIAYDYESD